MHFDASEASGKMIEDIISSANDICILDGICDHLGKINKDDLQNRQHLVSVVVTPGVLGDSESLGGLQSVLSFCS